MSYTINQATAALTANNGGALYNTRLGGVTPVISPNNLFLLTSGNPTETGISVLGSGGSLTLGPNSPTASNQQFTYGDFDPTGSIVLYDTLAQDNLFGFSVSNNGTMTSLNGGNPISTVGSGHQPDLAVGPGHIWVSFGP